MLNNLGTLYLRRGETKGQAMLDRGRELAEESGDEVGVGRSYLRLSLVLVNWREWTRADRYLESGTSSPNGVPHRGN